jgi:hypothetical protein
MEFLAAMRNRFALLGLLTASSCAWSTNHAAGDAGPTPDAPRAGLAAAPLSRVDDRANADTLCSPFALQAIERAADVLSAVTYSTAFSDCVTREMNDPITVPGGGGSVIPCSTDVAAGSSLTVQAQRLVEALRDQAHVQARCNFAGGLNSVSAYGTYGSEAERTISFNSDWRRETWPTSSGAAPWAIRAYMIAHEYAHLHDFSHPDEDCFMSLGAAERCAHPRCTWLTACGGSGVPAGPAERDAVDWRNRCSVENGLPEDEWNQRRLASEYPSSMMVGLNCVTRQIEESQGVCGNALNNPACQPGELRVLGAYDAATRAFTGACECRSTQRRIVSFQATSGLHYLQSPGGPGAVVQATSTDIGAWESFWMQDVNGGRLVHGDLITLKVYGNATFGGADTFWTASAAGTQVRGDSATDDTLSQLFQIRRVDGISGVVQGGMLVSLYALAPERYVNATNGGGAGVYAGSLAVGPWETFRYIEANRRQLAHIRFGGSSNYVQLDTSLTPELTTGRSAGSPVLGPEYEVRSSDTVVGTAERRRRAFWIIDHNGGALEPNDEVSFESAYQAGPGSHWSTCVTGTGNLRGDSLYRTQSCRRFVVRRVSGSGVLTHGVGVRLEVSGMPGRWLRATDSSGSPPNRVRADATSSASATIFYLDFVQEGRF